ncbi:hypothetical protein CHUAL_004979 [Chamberlinius hualienensis]
MFLIYSSTFWLIFYASIVKSVSSANVIVTTANGDVRGTTTTSYSGRTFYAFRGIPYAQPPVGNLRFQPPLPAKNWSGTFNATENGDICIQWSGGVKGVEDCLFVYVYTPFLPSSLTELLPVLVFIHGGGFAQGGPIYEWFPPHKFMDNDVVLAFIGYRLGPFGFLSTNDSASYGNYGLLDQVLALKWIQSNIESFGGDKSKVTIFGESAGGASVNYHQLSPASAGLFRAAISESGSSVCPWAFQKNTRFFADQLASSLKCPTNDTTNLVDCLKQKSAQDIVIATNNFNGYSLLELPFVPCVEDEAGGRFLTKPPAVILAEGSFNKVPTISGINKDEGDSTYSMTYQDYKVIDDNFYNNILPKLIYNLTKYERNLINVSYAVKAEYFDKIDVSNQTQVVRTAIDFNSDPFFKSATDYTIRMMSKYQVPAYMYSFEYIGGGSHNNYSGEGEVSHGDELYYLFPGDPSYPSNDQFISDHLVRMWVNFASTLDPTFDETFVWNPTPYQDEVEYLKISTNSFTMETGYLTTRMKFWEEAVPLIVVS